MSATTRNRLCYFSHPASANWFKGKLKEQHKLGILGHKNDRVTESFDPSIEWFDGTPQVEREGKYMFLQAKIMGEALNETHGDNSYLFARGAVHRSQPYSNAIWGGDVPGNLTEGLASNLAQL